MTKGKYKQKNWPMEYILGGIFVSAIVVLIVWGIQSVNPDDVALGDRSATEIAATGDDGDNWTQPTYRDYIPGETVTTADAAASAEQLAPADGETTLLENQDLTAGDETVDDDPTMAPITFAEAETAYHAGDYATAALGFTTWSEEHPHNPWGHYMEGLSLWKSGNLPGAELALENALAVKPDLLKAHLNLARVLMAQDRHQDALTRLESSSSLETDSAEFYRVQGRALHNLERRDEALAAYAQALAINADDPWSLNNSGLILIEEGRFEEATGALALATALEPGEACFFNNLGVALENCDHPAGAARAYAAGLALEADYPKAAANLARIEGLGGDLTVEGPDLAAMASEYAASLSSEPAEEGEPEVASLDPIF